MPLGRVVADGRVAGAARAAWRSAHLADLAMLQGRQHGRQATALHDQDDRDHHQELDQCEAAAGRAGDCRFPQL